MHGQPMAQIPRAARVGRVIFVTNLHRLLDTVFAEAFKGSVRAMDAAFGGHKKPGIGRETHKMLLDHYQQMKNVLVSHSSKARGFF